MSNIDPLHISHHEIDAAASTQDVGAGNHRSTPIKPFGWSRIVERCRLAVKFHVARVDAWSVNPWIVQVALASFDY